MDNSKNPKLKKNGGPGTNAGNFIRGLKRNILPALMEAVGVGDLGRAIGIIKSGTSDLTKEESEELLKLIELDHQDLKDARNMQIQIATSENSTILAKNFIYYLATAVFIFSAVIVILLFFKDIPDKNRDVVNFILGVVVGTGLTGVFQYFFGSSKGSSDKSEQFMNTLKK